MHGVKISDFRSFDLDKILSWVVSAFALLFPIAVLTVNRADSVILLLLGIIGTYVFLRHGIGRLHLGRQEFLLMGIFLGWYLVIVLCYFVGDRTDVGFKLLGRNLRLLFFIPAFIACRRYLRDTRFLWFGLALAPFGSLLYALWQFNLAHGDIRASGAVEVIPFGDLAIAMGFMALASFYVTRRPRRTWQYLLAGAALIAGTLTSILSGTRGGWIALPVLIVIAILVLSENSRKRAIKILIALFVLAILAISLSPASLISDRIGDAISNFSNYRGYLQLIKSGDIARHGCLNEKYFLENVVRQIDELHVSHLNAEVVNDSENLARAGFGTKCQSGYVIQVTDKNQNDNLMFRLRRIVPDPEGSQTVRFIVRGTGRVAIIYGYSKGMDWTPIDTDQYKLVEHTQDIKELSWPVFWVQAGSPFYFVPVQSITGEYVFPFVSSSVGERLEMWRAAWHIFLQHPLLGAGTGSFLDEVAKRVRSGDIFLQVLTYDHPHDDYLNALSSQGLVGLVFYLLSMGYPLILYGGALRSSFRYKQAAGFAGVITVSGLLVFGLTETMFTHSIVMSWYVVFTAMLMAVIFRYDDSERHDAELQ